MSFRSILPHVHCNGIENQMSWNVMLSPAVSTARKQKMSVPSVDVTRPIYKRSLRYSLLRPRVDVYAHFAEIPCNVGPKMSHNMAVTPSGISTFYVKIRPGPDYTRVVSPLLDRLLEITRNRLCAFAITHQICDVNFRDEKYSNFFSTSFTPSVLCVLTLIK